jgi:hypothetical protein
VRTTPIVLPSLLSRTTAREYQLDLQRWCKVTATGLDRRTDDREPDGRDQADDVRTRPDIEIVRAFDRTVTPCSRSSSVPTGLLRRSADQRCAAALRYQLDLLRAGGGGDADSVSADRTMWRLVVLILLPVCIAAALGRLCRCQMDSGPVGGVRA